MGFRTVVVFFNDESDKWKNDPELGSKIFRASTQAMGTPKEGTYLGYAQVVECCHAGQQTLGVFDSYNFNPVAHSSWRPNQESDQVTLELLRRAAEKLGYHLAQNPKKK